jgi:hypothetical protein
VSRAKPIAEREPLDFYATPDALALAICQYVGGWNSWASVIEPSAGHGPFVRAARSVWPNCNIIAVDIDPEKESALLAAGADVVVVRDWRHYVRAATHRERKLVLGNPPYRDAEIHIREALGWMEVGDELVFLLRLNLLGSRSRVALWGSTPLAEVVPIVPRPSFTGGGSDATEYALFRWIKGHTAPARLSLPLVWVAAREPRAVSGEGE